MLIVVAVRRLQYRFNSYNDKFAKFSGTAKLVVRDITLVNNCDIGWEVDPGAAYTTIYTGSRCS